MANLIEDVMNFGMGLFAYSRDQIEKTVEKLVDNGKVERKDAQSFTHQLVEQGAEERKEIQSMINSSVKENLEQMGLVQKPGATPLTAEEVREIVRQELAAAKEK